MKTANRIVINSVYGANPDTCKVLWESMEKSFRAFTRKRKMERILNSIGEK